MRARLLVVVTDLPAKAAIMNITQFNGEFGCPVCLHKDEQVSSVHVYECGYIVYSANDLPHIYRCPEGEDLLMCILMAVLPLELTLSISVMLMKQIFVERYIYVYHLSSI